LSLFSEFLNVYDILLPVNNDSDHGKVVVSIVMFVVSMMMLGVMSSKLVDLLHDGSDSVFVGLLGISWFREQLNFDFTNDWKNNLLVSIDMGISN